MKNIYIINRRTKESTIRKKYPDADILDVTSKSEYLGLRVLSPFYPHGNIPVPGMDGVKATCVEAVWQGLKVFEFEGVDYSAFKNDTMRNLKRTVRRLGKPLGHQYGSTLLSYEDARKLIYLPTYKYVLENVPIVVNTIQRIRDRLNDHDIVLLDYNTNENIQDYSKPLSHAALLKLYLYGEYPKIE